MAYILAEYDGNPIFINSNKIKYIFKSKKGYTVHFSENLLTTTPKIYISEECFEELAKQEGYICK